MELRLPLADLAVLLGEDATGLNSARLREKLVEFYGFLPDSTEIAVDGDCVVIGWPHGSASSKAEAERLAQKAAQRAQRGEHTKARNILKAVLELDPSATDARRDLAMVCVEMGDMDEAKNRRLFGLRGLTSALRANPYKSSSTTELAKSPPCHVMTLRDCHQLCPAVRPHMLRTRGNKAGTQCCSSTDDEASSGYLAHKRSSSKARG